MPASLMSQVTCVSLWQFITSNAMQILAVVRGFHGNVGGRDWDVESVFQDNVRRKNSVLKIGPKSEKQVYGTIHSNTNENMTLKSRIFLLSLKL